MFTSLLSSAAEQGLGEEGNSGDRLRREAEARVWKASQATQTALRLTERVHRIHEDADALNMDGDGGNCDPIAFAQGELDRATTEEEQARSELKRLLTGGPVQ